MTIIDDVVAALLHKYVPPPVAVIVSEIPEQVVGELTERFGAGSTVATSWSVVKQFPVP